MFIQSAAYDQYDESTIFYIYREIVSYNSWDENLGEHKHLQTVRCSAFPYELNLNFIKISDCQNWLHPPDSLVMLN